MVGRKQNYTFIMYQLLLLVLPYPSADQLTTECVSLSYPRHPSIQLINFSVQYVHQPLVLLDLSLLHYPRRRTSPASAGKSSLCLRVVSLSVPSNALGSPGSIAIWHAVPGGD